MRALISALFGIAGVAFFTALLSHQLLGEAVYGALIALSALVALVIYGFPRLAELDLKNLRLVLREVKEATERAKDATVHLEKVKNEVADIYGGIENLRKQPLILDNAKQQELGLDGAALAGASATMRYPAGCIKRERERLARIFINSDKKSPEQIAQAIVDNSMDDKVFKWNGPETGLDVPPKSVEQRKANESLPRDA